MAALVVAATLMSAIGAEAPTDANSDTPEARAEKMIAAACAGGVAPGQRRQLIGEAAGILESLTSTRPSSNSGEKLKHYFRLRLRLAEVLGPVLLEPHALRLMYLQGGSADRNSVLDGTEAPIGMLIELAEDIDDILQDWRVDMDRLVTDVPELEDMVSSATYKLGWLRFYRAIVATDPRKGANLLRNVILDVENFTGEDAPAGVRSWSLLLTGMAYRELGQYADAADRFTEAVGPGAPSSVRVAAAFETVRNLTEQKSYPQAALAVESFRKISALDLGDAGQMQTDLNSAILLNYVNEARSADERDNAAAGRYRAAAAEALVEFAQKYADPDVQAAFFDIIANRYADREAPAEAGSLIELAMAIRERSRGGAAALTSAQKRLENILSRDDAASVRLAPVALWHLAIIMNDRRESGAAARLFLRLAKEYPSHDLAFVSARNAAVGFAGVIDERRRARQLISTDFRVEFIGALDLLLGRWGDQDQAKRWYFELGWQCQEMSSLPADPAEQSEWAGKAIDAFEKVPSDLPEYMEARHHTLESRCLLLATGRQSQMDRRRSAQSLVEMLQAYAADATGAAKDATDGEVENLKNWAARGEFRTAEVLYDVLDRRDEAMKILRAIPQKFPGAPVLRDSAEFEVRKLVEAGQIDEAIARVDEFRSARPAEAQQLIQIVVQQVRRRVEVLRDQADGSQELDRYRQVYLHFSGVLYKRCMDLPPDQKYPFVQMYADALAETGKPAEAMELWTWASAHDAKRRREIITRITAEFEARGEALQEAGGNASRIKRMSREYFEELAELGIDPTDSAAAASLESAIRFFGESTSNDQHAARLKIVVEKLHDAYIALGNLHVQSVAADAANVRGLARTHRALGNYDQAVKLLEELVDGIDSSQYASMYWAAQLELCRCVLEGYRDDPKAMRRLGTLIGQLFLEDRMMGGLYGQFEIIRTETKKASQSPGRD